MGINMELPNKIDYEFIDFSGLDENTTGEIKAILQSDIASDVLKLPWDNGEKDYNSNSVVPETLEPPEHWQRYGLEETITTFDAAGTTASIITPSMSGTIFNGPLFVQYPDWAAYSNSRTGDPNAYQYMPSVPYPQQIYPPNEVLNASPSRDNDRRSGRGRNRKNDTYNRVINSDLQASYLLQPGQFNQMSTICHPGVSYIPYAVAPQHPAAGGPIYMPSHQPYNQPQIHTHHNNHPQQYTHPHYSTNTTGNQKHHTRQSSGQNYYSQDTSNTSKNLSNIHQKVHEKKIHDNNTDVPQPFRQLPNNNNDYEMKKNKSIVNNTNENSSTINNGHNVNAVPKKQIEVVKDIEPMVKTPVVDVRSCDYYKINNEEIVAEPVTLTTSITPEVVNPVEEITCTPCEQPVLPVKSMPIESTTTTTTTTSVTTATTTSTTTITTSTTSTTVTTIPKLPQVNGEDIQNDEVDKKLPEDVSTITQVNKKTIVDDCTLPFPPQVKTPPSHAERTWASVLKKSNVETRGTPMVCGNKTQIVRSNACESTIDIDTTKNHQQDGGFKRRSGPSFTADGETTSKTINNSVNDRKKPSKNSVQNFSCDPAVYRLGEFLLNYQMDKHTVSLLPRGLTNRSNYCYINSILQALLACPPFYNLLKALPHSRHPSKNSSTPLIDNMVKFVNEFDPLPEGQRLPRKDLRAQKKSEDVAIDIQAGIAFEPSYVYTMLKNASCAGVFSIEGRQEDAEEFLSCLLNGISDEMLELMKQVGDDSSAPVSVEPNVNYNSADEEWKVMGPRNKGSITRCTEFGKTPLSDIFRGQLRSRILRQGDESTDNVQPFFTLQLDIEKIDSVINALETLVAKDQVEGMTCSKTKQQIKAWKQVTFEELPVILILHLKWFDYKSDGCSKIFKNVSYGIDLKLDSKFLSVNIGKKLNLKQKQYKLFAVTYHDGKEATKGHYVTDAFHVGYGAWVRYDDSSVKGVSENDVLNPTIPRVPYLLYYRRCDTIGNNQPSNTRSR